MGGAPGGPPAPSAPLPHETERPPGEDGFVVVPLKYADVSEVVGVLANGLSVKSNDAFAPEEPAFGSPGLGGAAQAPPQQVAAAADDPVAQSVDDTIGIDRRLNAIILKGSPERIERLRAEIAKLDVPVRSVLLETMFVELDETGARNVGLDFTNSSGQIAVATFQTGGFIPQGQPTSHGLTSAQLQAAVYAQVQAGHGKIVSKPRIAAQSGGTAKIVTGDALPILTSIALSGVNAVSQQVQYVNVGVTLQIAPRVSGDGFVTSHIFCVVSSVSGTSRGYPTISQREAETSATVADGETFVIGGLTQESDIDSVSKVPGFGDLPAAGNLFSLKSGSRHKTELYIVVTPHVLADDVVPPNPERRADDAPTASTDQLAAAAPAAQPALLAASSSETDASPAETTSVAPQAAATPVSAEAPESADAPAARELAAGGPPPAPATEVAAAAAETASATSPLPAQPAEAPQPAAPPAAREFVVEAPPPAAAAEAAAASEIAAAASPLPIQPPRAKSPVAAPPSDTAPSAVERLAFGATLAAPARLTPASLPMALAARKPALIAATTPAEKLVGASLRAGAPLWEIGLAGLGLSLAALVVAAGWPRSRRRGRPER